MKPKEAEISVIPQARRPAGKSVHIITFGCQMNRHDSDTLEGLLEEAGYVMTERPEKADVILFNTCCVREHAEQRLYGRVSQLQRLKAKRSGLIIGIGGCVAQKEKGALAERFPHVDVVFGANALTDIVRLLERAGRGERPVIYTPENGDAPRSDHIGSLRPRVHAWVSIMRGCDNYCSYCVVPYVRGPQKSKHPDEVAEQARALARSGAAEITLLGQNVNSYGQDLRIPVTFAELLTRLHEVPGILRIRFTTSHPKDISTELMRVVRELPRVCEHIHLPVQSGSSRILKLMNRGYTSEDYLRIVDGLREIVPEISLTTDVIVGFPGETREDFEQTRRLLERVQFDGAYIFKFSARPGTAAGRLEGAHDASTIAGRHRELLEFQKGISLKRLQALVGSTQSVFPEKADPGREKHLLGRTRGRRMASFPGSEDLIGREVGVRISRLDGWTLLGEALERNPHHY